MTLDVDAVVGPDGWATRRDLVARIDRSTVDRWAATGKLVRLEAGVYATPSAAADERTRVAAAVRSRRAVVSHATALWLWGLVPAPRGPVHLLVDSLRSARGSEGVVLHRAHDLADVVRRVEGLPVACEERALVDTWGSPGALDRRTLRAAAIMAIRRRLCSPDDLAFEVGRRSRLPGRKDIAELVRLLAAGCRSELEIWGCLQVLGGPGMPAFVQQRPVVISGKRFFLDAAYDEVLMTVEMDGAAWHGSREQRQRDIRRDALLATAGWQTLRFGFARLTQDPDVCRREILAAYQARLRLFQPHRVR